jgi:membrane protein YdbS with pleckstrin-like domain
MERGNKNKRIILTAWMIWLRLGAAILLLIVAYGILAPILFSNSESDLGVFVGMAVVWLAPAFTLWIVYPIIKYIVQQFKNE